MSKKICKKLKEGGKIKQYESPKYFCKTCMAESAKEKDLCKPKKSKRA
jgi:hypothetical protein